MKKLWRVSKLLGSIHNTKVRAQSVWTQDNIVNSPYNDIEIPNLTVPEYIWQNLDKWADRTAVVCGITSRSFTYNQLYEYSRNFGATLRTHFNVKSGEVIGIMMPNTLEYPLAVIGALQAGATVTTINPMYTSNEVYRQLILAKPRIIISAPETANVLQEAIRMTKTEITVITAKNPNEDMPLNSISFKELVENNKIDKNTLKDVVIKSNDIVFLLYSSGTTGLPKGVEITNRNKVANFAQQDVKGIKYVNETTKHNQDSIMAVLPFYHTYGLSIILLHNLALGAKIVILPKFQPTSFLNALTNHKVNLLYAAPPLVNFLGANSEVKKEHLVSVNRLICAAAPIAKSDAQRVLEKCQPKLDFFQLYGMTELSPLGTCSIPGSGDHTTVGYAVPNSQLRVVNTNDQNLGPDKVGELLIRGPHVMKGYKDNVEATKAAILDDGWFRSGDLVSINSYGAVTIVDRIKELIKVAISLLSKTVISDGVSFDKVSEKMLRILTGSVKGYQVPPAELEELLKEHPDIQDAAVVGIPDEKKGEVPKAFIVLKEGKKTTVNNIKEFVSKNVAEYKRIQQIEFLEALPKNPSGKILRRVLKETNNNM